MSTETTLMAIQATDKRIDQIVQSLEHRMARLESELAEVRRTQQITNKTLYWTGGVIAGLIVTLQAGASEWIKYVFQVF